MVYAGGIGDVREIGSAGGILLVFAVGDGELRQVQGAILLKRQVNRLRQMQRHGRLRLRAERQGGEEEYVSVKLSFCASHR